MSGWLWMLRRFGPRRTFLYWRAGRRRGWIKTEAERRAFEFWLRARIGMTEDERQEFERWLGEAKH